MAEILVHIFPYSTLTRDGAVAAANRFEACEKEIEKKRGDLPKGWSCSDYPFATTEAGGKDARVQWVPESENNKQGGLVSVFYTRNQVLKGDKFIVKAVLKQ